eukprot:c9641_g1_i6.p1 GENE.c9641_g1_i6~~c9641_g1_i6.p1  ORF type:complete len:394 (-),score=87.53 c9641_g1_i6:85-1266(-)
MIAPIAAQYQIKDSLDQIIEKLQPLANRRGHVREMLDQYNKLFDESNLVQMKHSFISAIQVKHALETISKQQDMIELISRVNEANDRPRSRNSELSMILDQKIRSLTNTHVGIADVTSGSEIGLQVMRILRNIIYGPLVIFCLDISGSMKSSLFNETAPRVESALESMYDCLYSFWDDMTSLRDADPFVSAVSKGTRVCVVGFGGSQEPLVNILKLHKPGAGWTLPLSDVLKEKRSAWIEAVQNNKNILFGETPMLQMFEVLQTEIIREVPPVIVFVSDGEPTDDPTGRIPHRAQQMKSSGAIIVSCYATNSDQIQPKVLFCEPEPQWTPEMRLMLDCASSLSDVPWIENTLRSEGWIWRQQEYGISPKLFTQINQSTQLASIINSALSHLKR